MAFIGTPLDTRNTFQSLAGKRFNGDGSTTAFTLDVAPSSTLDIEVFVGNVRQDPNSAYTLSGTTLTFTGAPPSGTNNIYVVHQAKSVGTIDPPAVETVAKQFNGGVVFNEESASVDFRVESNGDANCLIVDGSEDKVGIGTSSPDYKFEIETADNAIANFKSTDANANIRFTDSNSTANGYAGIGAIGDALTLIAGNENRVNIDSAGHVTMPTQSACLVQKSANQNVNSTSLTVVTYDTEKFDQNADYGSNTFTAPVTGKYLLTYCVDTFNAQSGGYLRVDLVTSNTTFQQYGTIDTGSNEYFSREFSAVCDMDASDTAQVKVLHSNDTSWGISGGSATATTFSACLLA
jgi:hypothetical protein